MASNYIEDKSLVYKKTSFLDNISSCYLPINIIDWNTKELQNLDKLKSASIVALDIETFSSYDWGALSFAHGYIRLISLSTEDGSNILIDLGGWKDNRDAIYNHLKECGFWSALEEKLYDNTIIVGMNLKFDMGFLLYHYGLKTRNVRDIMLCSQVLWSGIGVTKSGKGDDRSERCNLPHSLKGIVQRIEILFNVIYDVDKTEQKSDWGWELTLSQIEYARKDSAILIDLYNKLKVLLEKAELTYDIYAECLALPVFSEMEVYGYPVNLNKVDEFILKYKEKQNNILSNFHQEFPNVLWTSNDQVLEAFNNKYFSKRKQKLESVSKGELQKWLTKYPIMQDIIEARTLSIYIAYLEKIKETAWDGCARTNYTQIVASGTGRTSCRSKVYKTAPDTFIQMQNPAKLLGKWIGELPAPREVFEAPEGYSLIISDISQAHNRIACQLSKDPTLLKSYREGLDLHSSMGLRIANAKDRNWTQDVFDNWIKEYKKGAVEEEAIAADRFRFLAKSINYGGLNFGGVETLRIGLEQKGSIVSREDIKIMKDEWKKMYRVLYDWVMRQINKTRREKIYFNEFLDRYGNPILDEYGSIRGLTGRRQFAVKVPSKFKEGELDVNFTDTISFMWLSAEASILKLAMGKILLEFDKHSEWKARIVVMAHDEINVICLEEYALEVATLVGSTINKCMERWITEIPVTDSVDYEKTICKCWNDK